jgi:hypothetical protein
MYGNKSGEKSCKFHCDIHLALQKTHFNEKKLLNFLLDVNRLWTLEANRMLYGGQIDPKHVGLHCE